MISDGDHLTSMHNTNTCTPPPAAPMKAALVDRKETGFSGSLEGSGGGNASGGEPESGNDNCASPNDGGDSDGDAPSESEVLGAAEEHEQQQTQPVSCLSSAATPKFSSLAQALQKLLHEVPLKKFRLKNNKVLLVYRGCIHRLDLLEMATTKLDKLGNDGKHWWWYDKQLDITHFAYEGSKCPDIKNVRKLAVQEGGHWHLPLVCKPKLGSGGDWDKVLRLLQSANRQIRTATELLQAAHSLVRKHKSYDKALLEAGEDTELLDMLDRKKKLLKDVENALRKQEEED